MSGILASLAWCSLQVTLVALLAWLLCGLARRTSSGPAAALPATALAAVIVLTVLAFAPWPRSWSYGPELGWKWNESLEPASKHKAAEDNKTERSPAKSELPLLTAPNSKRTDAEPAVETTLNVHLPAVADAVVAPAVKLETSSEQPPAAADSPSASPLPRPWPWPALMVSLLALGTAAGLLQLLLGLAAAGSYRRKSLLIEDKALHELVDVLCAQLRCRARVELRETSALATAATIGWRMPLVLLPLEWRDWKPEQLKAVLAHEIAHIARHDFLACVIAQASLALHFYHPLVHWLVRRLRLEQELAADAAAAAATGGRASYLQALAELALHQSERPLGWPARTFLPTRGTFMRRIEMLRDAKNGPAENSRWLTWPRRVAVLLLVVGAVAVAGLRGAAPPGETAQAQDKPKAAEETAEATPDSGTVNIAHLPNDSLAIAVLHIQPLLRSPETAEILRGLDRRTAASRAAAPLEKIQQIAIVLRSDVPLPRSEPIIVVEASQSIDFSLALRLEGDNEPPPEEIKEADLKDGLDRPQLAFVRLGEKAAALGSRRSLAWFLAAKRGNPGPAGGDGWKVVSSRPLVIGLDMMAARKLTPVDEGSHFKRMGLGPIWDETETVAAGINLGKKADLLVVADCLGEKGAKEVRETVDAGAIMVRNMLREVRTARLRQVADDLGARNVAEPEFVQFLYDAADKALSNVKVKQEGDTLISAQASVDLKGRLGTLSNLVPSVEALRANSRKAQSANNLKQIMLGMHNYADTYGGMFPPAVINGKDGKGKVPHSWRVELLPFLDQDALYRQYRFDEPWDSEANRKVLAQMPAVFRAPGADPKSTTSSYYVLVGKVAEPRKGEEGGGAGGIGPPGSAPMGGATGAAPGGAPPAGAAVGFVVDTGLPTAFSKKGGKEGIRFAEITDGTSNTLALVEAKRDIPWTKPEDIAYDPKGKAPMLGGIYDDGFWVGVCDGSVRFLPAKTDADFLRVFLSPAGGEVLPVDPPTGAEGARPVPVPANRDAPTRGR